MSRGHGITVDRIAIDGRRVFVDQVQSDLMAEKVEVYPACCCAPFATAEQAAIKRISNRQVGNGQRQMKRWRLIQF